MSSLSGGVDWPNNDDGRTSAAAAVGAAGLAKTSRTAAEWHPNNGGWRPDNGCQWTVMVTMTDEQSGTDNEADRRQREMIDGQRDGAKKREKKKISEEGEALANKEEESRLRRGREKNVEETERGHSKARGQKMKISKTKWYKT